VREELVEVNPIANRYIEIGDEYRDRGETQQAIESYQQALNANPGNLKAQTNIASVHLEQKDYEQAAPAFELALKIDDEDVAAKTGYCDSNLALGDAARGRGETEQAKALYQKILVINAAHSDARQRLAAIYREQAERQLAAGQDDEALSSFNRAMEFTPEDDELSTRYNEILAQKKAKVVADWLGKAEKALSRQRWDEAAGMVTEALQGDPKNEELQAKLVEVKDAPRQFKLQGYRREAEQAIARGNWEKAFGALETAIQLAPEDKTLREQLEAVRSDQLNAQLDLHRKGAEKAITAGDWEAAIAARQSALKLAPENPDLVRALEETRQAQHQAQLDLFQKQVDEAIAAGNWEAAIQAVQAAIKFAPKDAVWKNKLNEVEAARHQTQLDDLRAQAEAARKAQNWEAAIAALEDYRKLEPDDKRIQDEIEQLRVEKRASELKTFKAQAESAAKAEKWDEAVGAWESYLALEPEDGDGVHEKLQHARKYAKIAGDYTEAQEAIRKKRYSRAIELLQGIIAQEPTYKSTSRLLVEAVEANKAIPFWQRPWLLPAVGVLALVALGVFFGPQAWSAISTAVANRPAVATEAVISIEATSTPEIKATEPANITPNPTGTSETISSTPTATPLPAWVTDFAEPILAAIEDREPTFQDDFSTNNWGWYTNIGLPFTIEDGVLHFEKIQLDDPRADNMDMSALRNVHIDSPNLDLVLQVEISPPATGRVYVITNIATPAFGGSESWELSGIYLGPASWGTCRQDVCTEFPKRWQENQKVQVTLILQGSQAGFYLDGNPVDYFNDPEFTGRRLGPHDSGVEFLLRDRELNDTSCEFDNVKFWDLDAIDFSVSTITPTPEPTPAAESSSAWVTDFAEPILAAIEGHEPDFQDDFSTDTGRWASNGPSYTIEDGTLRFNDLQCDDYRTGHGTKLRNYYLKKPNYVLQVEISPLAAGRVYVLTNITRPAYSGPEAEEYSGIYLGPASWGTCRQDVCTEFPKLWQENQKVQVTLIVQGSQAGFYLDGNPVDYFNDPELVQAPRNVGGSYVSVEFLLINHCDIEKYWEVSLTSFDNVKFWDLDAIDLKP